MSRELEGTLGGSIVTDIAVQIGSGQHQHQRAFRARVREPGDGFGGTPGVKGDQTRRMGATPAVRRPFVSQLDIVIRAQIAGPAVGSLPVAVIGFAQRRADNRDGDLGRTHDNRV